MKSRPPRAIVLTLGLALLGLAAPAQAEESAPDVSVDWTLDEPFPQGATRFDAEKVGRFVYVLGFRDADNNTDGSIWTYNIKKGKWKDTGVDMPVPISNYAIAALEDDTGLGLYTFGGRTNPGEPTTVVQVYYPATGETKVIDSDPWPGTTPSECVSMPGTAVAVAGGAAYALGGMSFVSSVPPCVNDVSKEVWRFKPKAAAGKKWKAMPSLKVARGYVSPAVVGNAIYAIGGDVYDEAGALVAQPTVERWKVGAKKWNDTKFADLPVGCDESQAFGFSSGPLGGTITLAGCGQWPAAVTDVYQYDIAGDSWDLVGALNAPRRNHAGANIGSASNPKLFVVGGYDVDGFTPLTSTEIGVPGEAPFTGSPGQSPGARPGVAASTS